VSPLLLALALCATIDRVESGVAVLELRDRQLVLMSASALPPMAREGTRVRVRLHARRGQAPDPLFLVSLRATRPTHRRPPVRVAIRLTRRRGATPRR
jgi:hypothetical protein